MRKVALAVTTITVTLLSIVVGRSMYDAYRWDIYFWTHKTVIERRLSAHRLIGQESVPTCEVMREVEPTEYIGGAPFPPYEEYMLWSRSDVAAGAATETCRSRSPITRLRRVVGTRSYFIASDFLTQPDT